MACAATALGALGSLRLQRARLIWPALAATWAVLVLVGHLQILSLEDRINADIDATLAYLELRGVRAGLANYWLSYNVIALTDERVIMVPVSTDRYPAYRAVPARADRVATLQFLRRAAEGRLVRLPPDRYALSERRVFGEVVATIYRRRVPASGR